MRAAVRRLALGLVWQVPRQVQAAVQPEALALALGRAVAQQARP